MPAYPWLLRQELVSSDQHIDGQVGVVVKELLSYVVSSGVEVADESVGSAIVNASPFLDARWDPSIRELSSKSFLNGFLVSIVPHPTLVGDGHLDPLLGLLDILVIKIGNDHCCVRAVARSLGVISMI